MPFLQPRFVNTQLGNALEIFNSEWAAGVDLGTSHLLKQTGLLPLESLYQRGKSQFELPLGVMSMIQFAEKIWPVASREIIKDPIKKKCEQLYKEANKNIIWVETSGQADLGKSIKTKVPIGVYATGQSAFEFLGQIRMRRLEPYESPSGLLPKWVSLGNTVQVPCTASLAKNMPPGSEFELVGEGRLDLKFEIQAGLYGRKKKNLSLLVQKLPQEGKVLVKLSQCNSLEGSLAYKYYYDFKWSLGTLCQYVFEKLGLSKWTRPVSGIFEAKRQDNQSVFKQYVLDLSNTEQARAYEDLIGRFSIEKAEAVTQKQAGGNHETSYEINASANLADTVLNLFKVSESEKKSFLNQINYQESRSVREYISKWFSKISIIWEWVLLEDPVKKSSQSYCHLTFDSPYASDFFDVADSLKIPVLKEAREILSTYPKTNFHADIFFTDTGIKNIQKSSFEQAFESYLGLSGLKGAQRYGEIQNKWFFTRWYFFKEKQKLEQENPWLGEHRVEILKAYQFAKKMQPFKGSLKRFSDMKSVVSLMKLADPKETLIHELSLVGPGMGLFNRDEGMILHPEQEINQQFLV